MTDVQIDPQTADTPPASELSIEPEADDLAGETLRFVTSWLESRQCMQGLWATEVGGLHDFRMLSLRVAAVAANMRTSLFAFISLIVRLQSAQVLK
jgi:hypothetical protein